MMRAAVAAALVGTVVFGIAGCGGNEKGDAKTKENPKELTMYMGVVEQSAKVIAADFEKDTGIHVNFVRMSGGETLSRIRAEKIIHRPACGMADLQILSLWQKGRLAGGI